MIALAYRDIYVPVGNECMIADMSAEEVEVGLTLVAMVSIMDPLRDEVMSAVQQCQRAGITVKMLTGALCFLWPHSSGLGVLPIIAFNVTFFSTALKFFHISRSIVTCSPGLLPARVPLHT